MDILAERGIAAHYNGKICCTSLSTEGGLNKGSSNFMNNVDLARRVGGRMHPFFYDSIF